MKYFLFNRFVNLRVCALMAVVALLNSCTPTLDPQPGTGALGSLTADLSTLRYVALGNSLTAGYQSGAVVSNEVTYAYPTQLARQLNVEFGNDAADYQYMQLPDNGGLGSRLSIKEFSSNGLPVTQASLLRSNPSNLDLPRPYNNLGVPGAILADLHPPAAASNTLTGALMQIYAARYKANPFFPAVMRNPSQLGRTLLDQASRLNPTLVSIWIGNNDVLGYASSGGTDGTSIEYYTTSKNPAPTEALVFNQLYNTLLDSAVKKMPNAKFIIGNIPDVMAAPYFTAVGSTVRSVVRAALPAQVQQLVLAAFPNFPNGLPIRSSAAPGGFKILNDNDLILLPATTDLAAAVTSLLNVVATNPSALTDPQKLAQLLLGATAQASLNRLILDEAEQAVVKKAVNDFNTIIATAVSRYSDRMLLFDAYSVVEDVRKSGYPVVGSLVMNFNYISGGFFSLDGIHPSSRGYAAVTNEIIRTINRGWGANIPMVTIQSVPALKIGSVQ